MVTINENDLKMIQAIRRNPGNSKSELTAKVQMPWSSAYATITKLRKENMVLKSTDEENMSASKYREGVYINPNYEYYVGISVGSSQLKVVITGFDFNIVPLTNIKNTFPKLLHFFDFITDQNGLNFKPKSNDICQWCKNTPKEITLLSDILIKICKQILELKTSGIPIAAINFALPGHIDFYNQKIIETRNLCNENDRLQNIGISRLITSSVYDSLIENDILVYIDHNVKCSAFAEKEFRFTKTGLNDDLIVAYLGRGVGMSLILNGRLFRNKDNRAGQFGEVSIFQPCEEIDINNKSNKKEQIGKKVTLGHIIRTLFLDKIPDGKNLKDILEDNIELRKKLVEFLIQAFSDVIHIIGIKDIVFAGKFDSILQYIEIELTNGLEENGIYGVHLYRSAYGEYSAAIGAAQSCFNNKYGADYSWN